MHWKLVRKWLSNGWAILFFVLVLLPFLVADIQIRWQTVELAQARDIVMRSFLDANATVLAIDDTLESMHLNEIATNQKAAGPPGLAHRVRRPLLRDKDPVYWRSSQDTKYALIRIARADVARAIRLHQKFQAERPAMLLNDDEKTGFGHAMEQTFHKIEETANDLERYYSTAATAKEVYDLFELRHEGRVIQASKHTDVVLQRQSRDIDINRSWLEIIIIIVGAVAFLFTLAVYVLTRRANIARARMSKALKAAAKFGHQAKTMNKRLAAIWDTTPDPMLVIDSHGIIESVNPATAKLFGWTQHGLVGQKITALMPEPYLSEHDGYIQRYEATNEPHVIGKPPRLVKGQKKTGQILDLELSVAELKLGGGLRQYSGILRDVTEREAEREKLRIRGETLAMINQVSRHDLRNPLDIIGFSLENIREELSPEQIDEFNLELDLEEVENMVSKSQRILNGLTIWTKVLESEEEAASEVDTGAVIRKLVDESGYDYEVSVTGEFPVLQTYAELLSICVDNIIRNACIYTFKGRDPNITVWSNEHRICITDEGRGTDIALDKLVVPFKRYAPEPGSGVGLAIVNHAARSMGFELTLESVVGEGSTFSLVYEKESARKAA